MVVGDAMVDVVVRPLEPLRLHSDTASDIRLGRGGSGANIAMAMARAGHDVTFVGAVGDDVAGEVFARALEISGVKGRLEVTKLPTGVVVSLVEKTGERSMLTYRGANAQLSEHHLLPLVSGVDHVHVSGYLVLDPRRRGLTEHVLAKSHESGATTSVDACSLGPLADMGRDAFFDVVTGVEYFFANADEAAMLGGIDQLASHFGEVAVTQGASGASVAAGSTRTRRPALGVEVIDTTGAGDAFTGAYLAERLRPASIDVALSEALRASADVVGTLGA